MGIAAKSDKHPISRLNPSYAGFETPRYARRLRMRSVGRVYFFT